MKAMFFFSTPESMVSSRSDPMMYAAADVIKWQGGWPASCTCHGTFNRNYESNENLAGIGTNLVKNV